MRVWHTFASLAQRRPARPPSAASSAAFKYWAFISYSHRDEEQGRWGSWLHKAIETYRVPWPLVGRSAGDVTLPARLLWT